MKTNIDVSYSYWSHKRQWRIRAFMPGATSNEFGRVLSEDWKRNESAARKAALALAASYGVTMREPI